MFLQDQGFSRAEEWSDLESRVQDQPNLDEMERGIRPHLSRRWTHWRLLMPSQSTLSTPYQDLALTPIRAYS